MTAQFIQATVLLLDCLNHDIGPTPCQHTPTEFSLYDLSFLYGLRRGGVCYCALLEVSTADTSTSTSSTHGLHTANIVCTSKQASMPLDRPGNLYLCETFQYRPFTLSLPFSSHRVTFLSPLGVGS